MSVDPSMVGKVVQAEYSPHYWDQALWEEVAAAMGRCNLEVEVVGLAAPPDQLLENRERKYGQTEAVAAAVKALALDLVVKV